MATTYLENGTNTPNGSHLEFSYTFPVLKTEDVKVALNGVTQATTKYAVDNTSNPTKITFNNTNIDSDLQESTGAPKTGVVVRVYRDTDVDAAKAVYAAGSSIRALDLNNNQDQILYALQEEQNQKGIFEEITLDDDRKIKLGNSDDFTIYWENSSSDAKLESANDIVYNTAAVHKFEKGNDTLVWFNTGTSDFKGHVKPWSDDTYDLGSSDKQWKDLYVDGTAHLDFVSIGGGIIDSTAIGSNVASTGRFTTLTTITSATIDNNLVVTGTISDSGGNLELDDNVDISGSLTVDGNVTLGDANTDLIVVNSKFNSSLLPNGSHKGLGAAGNTWHWTHTHDLYTYGTTTLGSDSSDTITVKGAADFDHTLNVDGLATLNSITGSAIVTSGTSTSDTQVYSAKRCDELYYNIGTTEEIVSGEAWVSDDAKVATTAAIDARIVDLVDDVGGFVPIANELSFPNANPDVNNGAGTLISVPLANTWTANSNGKIIINNGTVGNSTVTIVGAGINKTYTAGFGIIVETTTTLNEYAFHRYVPKATEVTTVAGRITNVNSVAGNASNINTVAGISGNVTTVAGISANVTTVANDGTDIGTVAGSIGNVNTTAGSISNVNTTAGSIANVNTTAGSIASVNTTALNINNVNSVGNNIGNVNTVAGIQSDVTAVAGDATDIGTCSTNIGSIAAIGADLTNNYTNIVNYGAITDNVTSTSGTSYITTVANSIANVNAIGPKATEIGRLGTADAVADMAILGTTDCVADMAILATADVVADLNTLGTADVVSDMNTLATAAIVSDMDTLADISSNISTVSSNNSNVTTCANNITDINNASTNAANALAYKNSALTYRNEASAILTQVESSPYNLADNVSSHTAWGDITDTGANAVFTNESSNILLTMAEGSSSYNYGSIT